MDLFRVTFNLVYPYKMYDDPHENYCRLQRTVKYLQAGGRITEDWIEEHKRHVRKYSEIFWNMSEFHPEITDPTFRQKAKEVEVLLEYLRITFDVRGYFQLNQDLARMTEILMDEDDLLECMNKLAL
jgi:hypothetical protein